jgi:hypothetical protein
MVVIMSTIVVVFAGEVFFYSFFRNFLRIEGPGMR